MLFWKDKKQIQIDPFLFKRWPFLIFKRCIYVPEKTLTHILSLIKVTVVDYSVILYFLHFTCFTIGAITPEKHPLEEWHDLVLLFRTGNTQYCLTETLTRSRLNEFLSLPIKKVKTGINVMIWNWDQMKPNVYIISLQT